MLLLLWQYQASMLWTFLLTLVRVLFFYYCVDLTNYFQFKRVVAV